MIAKKDTCQFFRCKQRATMKIINANMLVCDDHYLINVLRFGCQFDVVVLKTGEKIFVDN